MAALSEVQRKWVDDFLGKSRPTPLRSASAHRDDDSVKSRKTNPKIFDADDLRGNPNAQPESSDLKHPTRSRMAMVIDQDRGKRYEVDAEQVKLIKGLPEFIDNFREIHVHANWIDVTIEKMDLVYSGGKKFTVDWDSVSFGHTHSANLFIRKGGIYYPCNEGFDVEIDVTNTPNIVLGKLKIEEQATLLKQKREEIAWLVYIFGGAVKQLGGQAATVGGHPSMAGRGGIPPRTGGSRPVSGGSSSAKPTSGGSSRPTARSVDARKTGRSDDDDVGIAMTLPEPTTPAKPVGKTNVSTPPPTQPPATPVGKTNVTSPPSQPPAKPVGKPNVTSAPPTQPPSAPAKRPIGFKLSDATPAKPATGDPKPSPRVGGFAKKSESQDPAPKVSPPVKGFGRKDETPTPAGTSSQQPAVNTQMPPARVQPSSGSPGTTGATISGQRPGQPIKASAGKGDSGNTGSQSGGASKGGDVSSSGSRTPSGSPTIRDSSPTPSGSTTVRDSTSPGRASKPGGSSPPPSGSTTSRTSIKPSQPSKPSSGSSSSSSGSPSKPPREIPKEKLGKKLGEGGNKDAHEYGDKVVAVLKDGKKPKMIDDELDQLNRLKEQGIPTVNAEKVNVGGRPALLMDQFEGGGSKSVVAYRNGKMSNVGDSPYLNARSVADLNQIRNTLVTKKIKVDDLQFLIGKDGRVVVADPLKVTVGEKPSKNNLQMIDKLIAAAQKNTGVKK